MPDKVSQPACRHQYQVSEGVLFVGTEGSRLCAECNRAEVLMDGRWVAIEDYYAERRASVRSR